MEDYKEYSDISMGYFFKYIEKEIKKTLDENPNHVVTTTIVLKSTDKTDADVLIEIDKRNLILDS